MKLKTDLLPRCSVSAGDIEWVVIKYGAKTVAIGAAGMKIKPFISCIDKILFGYKISRYKAVRVRKKNRECTLVGKNDNYRWTTAPVG